MRIIRTFISFVLCFVVYFAYSIFIEQSMGNFADNQFLIFASFIISGGLAAFLAFLVSGALAPREWRDIVFGLLLFFLYGWLFYDLILITKEFWAVLGSIMRLSFGALGAIIAIQKTSEWGKVKYSKPQKGSKPKLPLFFVTLALISIPLTYIVIFLSFFITVGISSWLMMIVLQLPRIPVVLIAALGLAPLFSGISAVKGLIALFKSREQSQSAFPVDKSRYPRLIETVEEVCGKLKTPMPDHIILHGEPTFFVTQGKMKLYGDQVVKGRILAIGAPLLYQLETNELKGILAHEFAHFTGNDTTYSKVVLPVYLSISSVLRSLGGVAADSSLGGLVNILLLVPRFCILAFIRYFDAINNLINRSRELRADWIAAENFGQDSIKGGLTKAVGIGEFFYDRIYKLKPEGQLFSYFNQVVIDSKEKLLAIEEKAMAQEDQIFDSHPSLATRLNNLPPGQVSHMNDIPMQSIVEELEPLLGQLSEYYGGYLAQVKEILKARGMLK